MSAAGASVVTMYFDGACHLCSREAEHYRRRDTAKRLRFVDISTRGFDPVAEGVDPVRVQQHIHARRVDGRIVTGVDAFIAFWEVLPGYGWLARLAAKRGLRPILDLGYEGFSRVRPYLPRRKEDCPDGACAVRQAR